MLAYRHNQLVYIPISKHASTSYRNLFRYQLGWTEIQTDTIDWADDHVFSHIIDPYERHLKGTAEAMSQYNITDLIDDPRFLPLWTTAIFDIHSYPLFISFGENINKIDWLVLDHPTVSGNKITVKFLNDHGINISESDIGIENSSSKTKKQLLEKLRELKNKNRAKFSTLTYFYDTDGVVYSKVMARTKFDCIDRLPWSQLSWLANEN